MPRCRCSLCVSAASLVGAMEECSRHHDVARAHLTPIGTIICGVPAWLVPCIEFLPFASYPSTPRPWLLRDVRAFSGYHREDTEERGVCANRSGRACSSPNATRSAAINFECRVLGTAAETVWLHSSQLETDAPADVHASVATSSHSSGVSCPMTTLGGDLVCKGQRAQHEYSVDGTIQQRHVVAGYLKAASCDDVMVGWDGRGAQRVQLSGVRPAPKSWA